jgi:hypothetical protein
MLTHHLTTIPFQGFYESIHDANLDRALEMLGDDVDPDWRFVHASYAAEYCASFGRWLGLDLKFVELSSPREYNFETDRIFAKIGRNDLIRVYEGTPRALLRQRVTERFTSCSGFISYYSNKLEDWSPIVTEWDHNMIGTMLEVYAEYEQGSAPIDENSLMEDALCNGMLENWIDQ